MPEVKEPYKNFQAVTPKDFPMQHQNEQPGSQQMMNPAPVTDNPNYRASEKLAGRVAIVSGGDSGIGQAAALAFAKEGADIVIPYYSQKEDAQSTSRMIEQTGRRCLIIQCDLKQESAAADTVNKVANEFGHIDILVNNIAVQYPQNSILDITAEQLANTFIPIY